MMAPSTRFSLPVYLLFSNFLTSQFFLLQLFQYEATAGGSVKNIKTKNKQLCYLFILLEVVFLVLNYNVKYSNITNSQRIGKISNSTIILDFYRTQKERNFQTC